MMKVTIHATGSGICSLTGKDSSDGLTVSFEDGTLRESFLSWKAFRQLLGMKTGQNGRPEPKATAGHPPVNQPVVAVK